MKRLALLVAGLALVAPTAVQADDHYQLCSSAHEAGTAITVPTTGVCMGPTDQLNTTCPGAAPAIDLVCYDTNGTTDGGLVDFRACEHVDWQVYNLTDGTTADVGVQYMACGSASTSNCVAIAGKTFNGDDAVSVDTFQVQGIGLAWGYVKVDTNSNTDDIRVLIRCNP